jgi:hypothetical protein
VTFLNLRDFLLHKPFVVSVGFGEKSKKSQALSESKNLRLLLFLSLPCAQSEPNEDRLSCSLFPTADPE